MLRKAFLLTAGLVAIASLSFSESDSSLDIKQLEGKWKGNGTFIVPMTGIAMDIEGQARFDYVDHGDYLRTQLTGDKFLFKYADSGHLVHYESTDSVSWEVWDNFGKHAKYYGDVDGNIISGTRKHGKDLYRVMIEMVSTDSIEFRLSAIDPEGNVSDKATFSLWRVKD